MDWDRFWTIMIQLSILAVFLFILAAAASVVIDNMRKK